MTTRQTRLELLRNTCSGGMSAAAWVRAVGILLAACAGAEPVSAPLTCSSGSAYDGAQCQVFASRSVERIPTPWMDGGRALTLEMVVYRPLGASPFPTVIFHHGSTGSGDNPALFGQTFTSETIAKVLADQGWMVLFPQRRGRGASDGLYDEGLEPDRSRYSCRQTLAQAGLSHALEDAEVIYEHVRGRADVDATRLLVGGQSRGGVLAVAHAAQRPAAYRGTLNFVGGWLGEGCADAVVVNRTTFAGSAGGPRMSLWMYGENDPFYSAAHSRSNFDAFVAAGGAGGFRLYQRGNPNLSGHLILNEPTLWQGDVQAFIAQAR